MSGRGEGPTRTTTTGSRAGTRQEPVQVALDLRLPAAPRPSEHPVGRGGHRSAADGTRSLALVVVLCDLFLAEPQEPGSIAIEDVSLLLLVQEWRLLDR